MAVFPLKHEGDDDSGSPYRYIDFQKNLHPSELFRVFDNMLTLRFTKEEQRHIREALYMSIEAHQGQLRADGSDYIVHPVRVALLMAEVDSKVKSDMLSAALLHDAVEDSNLTIAAIADVLGSEVAHMVEKVTRERPANESAEERKRGKVEKWNAVMNEVYEVRLIKTCDFLDNVISWKFINMEQAGYSKLGRWLMEAITMYLPLAQRTSEFATRLLAMELERYRRGGLVAGNWFTDRVIGRLSREGTVYIDTAFDHCEIGPERLRLDQTVRYRFMDFFYVRTLPQLMTPAEIEEVCKLREKYFDKVVDNRLNAQIADALLNAIRHKMKPPCRVLDFGCGSGHSLQLLRERLCGSSFWGVDMSQKLARSAREQGWDVQSVAANGPLPFKDASFDVVTAIFVMFFPVPMAMIAEIERVLRCGGIFVFNMYKDNASRCRSFLLDAGFTQVERAETSLRGTHYVMVARKSL